MTPRSPKTPPAPPAKSDDAQDRRTEPVRPALDVDGFSDDYLSAAAHDLRGSLNSIIGWAELIRRKALPADGNVRAGETIVRQALHQLDLINELVDTWRLLSGNLQLKFAPVDAHELISQAVHGASTASKKSVSFDVQAETIPAPLLADGTRLRQVLVGLLNSALHFAPDDSVIRVALTPGAPGYAELTVHDDGPAIAAAALPSLFSRQRPTDPAKDSVRAKFGRGLGLIRDIVDLHGGTISADTGGAGATFRITLPLVESTRAVRPDGLRELRHGIQSEVRTRLADTVVLIVDDDPDAREVLAAILRHYGAAVIVATSVATAMAALRRENVDVIVSDLAMPQEDGYDLIRQVRESSSPKVATIPAAALTAYSTEEDRQRVLAAGFQIHMSKPVDPAVLVAIVERLRTDEQPVH